ncbi:Homeobox-leucine zipper protein ATHB-14, partial [Zea mays]
MPPPRICLSRVPPLAPSSNCKTVCPIRPILLAIAEETLAKFLSKATGTAIDWVQMVGMKPGPDSIGIIAVSHNCSGVAAQADQGL